MFSDLMFRLRAIFRRTEVERELDQELRFHLEHQIAKYMDGGLSREQAERRASLEFGGIEQVKEDSRDSRGVTIFDHVFRDVCYSVRVLGKSPGFTAVAILSLALGIGANTAIFQLLDAIRLRMLPVRAPQELAEIRVTDMTGARGSINRDNSVTYPIWEQIRRRQQAFSGIFAWSDGLLNLSPSGEVRMAQSLWVTGEFFPTLGIKPVLGRLFTPADDYRGCDIPGAVISYSFWQSEYGGDPSAIGRKLSLNGRSAEVIGVTPSGFTGLEVGRAFRVAVPVCSVDALWFKALDSGTFWWLAAMGRLKPGWSLERATAQLNSMSAGAFEASLPPNYPAVSVTKYLNMKLTALPAGTGVSQLRDRYSDPLWMLLAIAGLVLLIACANLANLMLARASGRDREIAVRLAIGASRKRLVAQLMTESSVIAVAGAGLGLLAAYRLSRALVLLLGAGNGSAYLNLDIDWRVFAFTCVLAILTCLLFGLAPALRATTGGPSSVLKSSGRGITTDREKFGLRRFLVAAQIALSLVLLVGALLFAGSLRNLLRAQTGFRQDGILIANLSFARADASQVRVLSFQRALLARIQGGHGVISVADTSVIPIGGSSWSNRTWMDGADSARSRDVLFSRISPGYFRTLGTPLLDGRDFDDRDMPASQKVAIVNEAFARRVANMANPVGQRFRVEATPSTPEMVYEIIGVAGNTKYRTLRENFEPVFYLPLSQDPSPALGDQLLIRSNLSPSELIPAVRRAIGEADPNAHFSFQEYKALIDESLLPERLMATLSSAFGVLAALLSAIGIYGVISYLVARRRNEIGIRMALGANRREIIFMILRETGRVLMIGLAVGTVLSLFAARFARTMLFGLKPYDAVTVISAAALLALVGLAATYLPARRAASLDPMAALRDE